MGRGLVIHLSVSVRWWGETNDHLKLNKYNRRRMSLIQKIQEKSPEELAFLAKQEGLSCALFSSLFRTILLVKNQGYLPQEMEEDLEALLEGRGDTVRHKIRAQFRTDSDNLVVVSSYLAPKSYHLTLANPMKEEDLGEEPDYDQKWARLGYLRDLEYLGLMNQLASKYPKNYQKVFVEDKAEFIEENIGKNPLIGFKPDSEEYKIFPPLLGHCLCLLFLQGGKLIYFDPWFGEIREREKDYFYSRIRSDLLIIEKGT
jgi:hypothetical protein